MAAANVCNFIHFRNVRDQEPKVIHSFWKQTGLHQGHKRGAHKRTAVSLGSRRKKMEVECVERK